MTERRKYSVKLVFKGNREPAILEPFIIEARNMRGAKIIAGRIAREIWESFPDRDEFKHVHETITPIT